MLLDSNHLLLRDEAVPATERLGILRGIGIIGRHVFAHNFRGVARNIKPGLEPILKPHPRDSLGINSAPSTVLRLNKLARSSNVILVRHFTNSFVK